MRNDILGNNSIAIKFTWLAPVGMVALFVMSIIFGAWYTIDEGERGVVLRTGKVIDTAEPGLHFKLPFFDSVVKLSTQTRKVVYTKMATYSNDQQLAYLEISVNYRIDPSLVQEVYSTFGSEQNMTERLISPKVFQETKVVFGGYTAAKAIQKRGELNAEINELVAKSIKGPVTIESLQVEDISFSQSYETSIERRMQAEVEVQQVRQNADREKIQAEIVRTKAQAEADSKVAQAEAEAKAIKTKGDAEAYAIEARGKADALSIAAKGQALRDNPSMINLLTIERWSGSLPKQMIPGATVPFINLSKISQ